MNGVPSLIAPFAGCLVCLLILSEVMGRCAAVRAREMVHPDQTYCPLASLLPVLIAAFLCLVGSLLLLPWAASLSLQSDAGLQIGIGFAVLFTISMLYVSTRNGPPR